MSDRRLQKFQGGSYQLPSIDELLSAARGRWLEILNDAGLPLEHLDGRGHPCPRCGGRDRFAAWPDVADRGAVHCRHCFTKGSDPKPGDGLASLRWLLGSDTAEACRWLASWLGVLGPTRVIPQRVTRSIQLDATCVPSQSFKLMADLCHQAMRVTWWERLSDRLGLPMETLRRLRVGWSESYRATTWPMVNDAGRVLGIRLRSMTTGDKWSIRGGRAGLFVPVGLSERADRLFIAEGPTDTAALLSLGVDAIGRPSCHGAVSITAKLVAQLRPAECVIVADRDEHGAGMRGAESLAVALVTVCRSVRIILPPVGSNDARDWITGGATLEDVLAVTDAAAVRSITITSGVNHG